MLEIHCNHLQLFAKNNTFLLVRCWESSIQLVFESGDLWESLTLRSPHTYHNVPQNLSFQSLYRILRPVGLEPTRVLFITLPRHQPSLQRGGRSANSTHSRHCIVQHVTENVKHFGITFNIFKIGGSGEIRTHGPLRACSFQDCWIKPLSHTSF
jgi:hypothetical protein